VLITAILNKHCSLGGENDSKLPDSWLVSKIISIPKKGNDTSLENQRGIALESTMVKLLNSILRNRIIHIVDPLLLCIQSGFRPGRSTMEQVATVRSIVETCRTRKKSISLVFVDFRKAFDSISRPAIRWVLLHYGLPSALVHAIMDLYQDTTAFIDTRDGPTDPFSTTSGVLQGDTLAPLLFVIVIDYVMRRSLIEDDGYQIASRRSRRHPAVTLAALAYADDLALTCKNPEAAQNCLNRLSVEGSRVGLQINAKKTEVLHIGFENPRPLTLPDGDRIRECQDFKYLGSLITSPDDIITDRRSLAWRAIHLLAPIFTANVNDKLKLKIFHAAVEPILLYGLETVPATPSRELSLDSCHRAMLRFAINIRYPHIISNQDLSARTRTPPLSHIIRLRRQRLLGHVLRSHGRGDHNPLAMVILNPPHEGIRRGQATTTTLVDTFLADLHALDLTPSAASRCPSQLYRDRLCAGGF
jgi:hypothetical protein